MINELKPISQSGIRELLKEPHENPEKKPSQFDNFSEIDEQDFNLAFFGISYDLVEEFRNYIKDNDL